MVFITVSKVKCNVTSGGAIQLKVGDKPLLPDFTLFNVGNAPSFGQPVDLGSIVGATLSLSLYDSHFSTDASIYEVAINNTLTSSPLPTLPFNYDVNRWTGEGYVIVSGAYEVTYQVTDTPGGVVLTYLIRVVNLVVQLFTFTIAFVRDLFLSLTLSRGRVVSKDDDSSRPK